MRHDADDGSGDIDERHGILSKVVYDSPLIVTLISRLSARSQYELAVRPLAISNRSVCASSLRREKLKLP